MFLSIFLDANNFRAVLNKFIPLVSQLVVSQLVLQSNRNLVKTVNYFVGWQLVTKSAKWSLSILALQSVNLCMSASQMISQSVSSQTISETQMHGRAIIQLYSN